MNLRRIVLILLVVVVGCKQQPREAVAPAGARPAATLLRIPETPFMALLPLYVADERGFFTRHGYNVKWVPAADPGQARNLLVAGHADLTLSTFASLLAVEAKQPGTLTLELPFFESSSTPASFIVVPSTSLLQSPQQLAGKRLGTYTGPSQKVYAELVLDRLGLKGKTQLVQVAETAQVTALFGGTFDALFAVEPYGTIALQHGGRALVTGVRPRFLDDPFWVGAVAVRPQLFGASAAKRAEFRAALAEAAAFIASHPREARAILARRARFDARVADDVRLYTWRAEPSSTDCSQIGAAVQQLVAQQLLATPVDVNRVLGPCAEERR